MFGMPHSADVARFRGNDTALSIAPSFLRKRECLSAIRFSRTRFTDCIARILRKHGSGTGMLACVGQTKMPVILQIVFLGVNV